MRAWRHWPEMLLAALVVIGLAASLVALAQTGRLPPPFYLHADQSLMDWFDTAWWAHHGGAFDRWRTVYPPLSFVLLRVVGDAGCYADTALAARECDGIGRAAIVAAYVAGAGLAARAFFRADAATAPMRGVAFALGLPMLFALERGNLVLVAFVAFALAHGDLVTSRWGKAVAAAVTINVKPYLVLPALAPLLRNRRRPVATTAAVALLLYAATWAMLGEGDPRRLIANTLNWVDYTGTLSWTTAWYSTSYATLALIPAADWPAGPVPYGVVAMLAAAAPWAIVATIAVVLAALAVAAGVGRDDVPPHRAALLLLALVVTGQSAGGYTQVFLLFLLFLERWERPGPIVALVAGYLLCVAWDPTIGAIPVPPVTSWLTGASIAAMQPVGLGLLLRPGLILVMVWALALDTIGRRA